MAAFRLKIRECLITLLFSVVLCADSLNAQKLPTLKDVEKWASDLSQKLVSDVNYTTGYTILDHAYNNHDGKYQNLTAMMLKFEKLDATDLVNKMAMELKTMLESKMEALRRSVRAAEEAAENYLWDSDIKKESVEYVNTKELMENDSRLVYSDRFHQMVIPNISSVHIPVEIYNGDVEILNGLKWSASLDDIFTTNAEKDPGILWQYFGSQTGFMRTWPGSKWNIGPDVVDLYDVRRRPWYTQGSSSPKDMFILIDSSGSVHGKALELVKVAVKSLLDTLGENDFVNIAQFSKEAKFISECFNGSFAQANYRNKEILKNDVNHIEANGMADFKVGFSFAFEQFIKLKNQSEGNRGAGCNNMIMLFTDGGTDHAQEVFDHYNPKDNMTVRVFTYAVGPTANPISAIRWMACRNRGFFSQIPAMGAIRSKVQEYLIKSAEALAINNVPKENLLRWHRTYDPRGLGMMTTVTLPVYNRTHGSGNQTILGVMGIDVTIAEMQKHEPTRKLGPNGYSYSINANGDVVFHPELRFAPELKDPPNVDFLDVEVEDDVKDQMRRDMIDMKSGTVTVDTFKISQDRNHADPEKRVYSFVGLDKTAFSLGICLPEDQKYALRVETDISDFDKGKKLLNTTSTGLLIAAWDYYKNFTSSENLTGTIADLEEAIRSPSEYQWNHELINHLLWDISVTSSLNEYWPTGPVQLNGKSKEGKVATFVGTNGGLTRFHPKTDDIVDTFLELRNTWETDYYRRAISSPLYLFSAPFILEPDTGPNATANDVMVAKSVKMYNTSKLAPDLEARGETLDYKAAVVGAIFTHQSIQERLETTATSPNVYDCGSSDNLACYLLDDGAFLIATNQDSSNTSIGMFFGKVDPELMYQLFNKSMYLRQEKDDFQATCSDEPEETTSAGTLSFNIPSVTLLYELLTFNWWTSVVTWTFTNFNLYNMIFTSQENYVEAYIPKDKTWSCVKKHAQYYFTPDVRSMTGQTDCEVRTINCSRDERIEGNVRLGSGQFENFMAVRVIETNLLLVVTEAVKPDCEVCRELVPPEELIQEGKETTPLVCNVPPRYRNHTETCYDYDRREDPTKCSGSLISPLSQTILCLVSILSILLSQR